VGCGERITGGFLSVFVPFKSRDAFFDADCASRLAALLVSIGRATYSMENPIINSKQDRLRNSLQYIQGNFNKPVSVASLAAMDFLSESRYRSLFHNIMKKSPIEYIFTLRMNLACELLANTDLSILQVSRSAGWPDQRYFSRLFKERFGITPSVFRKNKRKSDTADNESESING